MNLHVDLERFVVRETKDFKQLSKLRFHHNLEILFRAHTPHVASAFKSLSLLLDWRACRSPHRKCILLALIPVALADVCMSTQDLIEIFGRYGPPPNVV